MPRPTKLSSDVQSRILDAVSVGMPMERAPLYGGVTYQTMRNWIHRAEKAIEGGAISKADAPYVGFLEAYEKAAAEAEYRWNNTLDRAASGAYKGQWQAHAWKLERRYPKDYGKRDALDVTSGGEPIIPLVFRPAREGEIG